MTATLNQFDFVQLTEREKSIISLNAKCLTVFASALLFEFDLIEEFLSGIDSRKKVPRKCARIPRDVRAAEPFSALRDHIDRNFGYLITKQEIYWLICDYLMTRCPNFR